MKKPLPELRSDDEAERFLAEADLAEYDLSGLRMVRFEFQPKSERVNLRVPKALLDAVKTAAAGAGIPYQRFIRQVLEAAVQHPRDAV
ncbi:MAG TPA: CopG family antitoxin [Stellaceae bacterium]|jgi:predicted DNA binding CopG/RHH family protein|nr:CopG family antitoxin [Stellaceae bacterium]